MAQPAVCIVQLPEFNPMYDDWIVYKKQMLTFLQSNRINDINRRRTILLHSLNQRAYNLLQDLCLPSEPETKTFDQIVEIFDLHFGPKSFTERDNFYKTVQFGDESVSEWASRVKLLAESCKFGPFLETAMRDKFVLGLHNYKVKDILFMEAVESLTFSEAIKKAQAVVTALRIRVVK